MIWRWWAAYTAAFVGLHFLPQWWRQFAIIVMSALGLGWVAYEYIKRLKHKPVEKPE